MKLDICDYKTIYFKVVDFIGQLIPNITAKMKMTMLAFIFFVKTKTAKCTYLTAFIWLIVNHNHPKF